MFYYVIISSENDERPKGYVASPYQLHYAHMMELSKEEWEKLSGLCGDVSSISSISSRLAETEIATKELEEVVDTLMEGLV